MMGERDAFRLTRIEINGTWKKCLVPKEKAGAHLLDSFHSKALFEFVKTLQDTGRYQVQSFEFNVINDDSEEVSDFVQGFMNIGLMKFARDKDYEGAVRHLENYRNLTPNIETIHFSEVNHPDVESFSVSFFGVVRFADQPASLMIADILLASEKAWAIPIQG